MTPTGLVALRKAIVLAHQIEGVRLRLVHQRRAVAEVGWHESAGAEEDEHLIRLTPCRLRAAMAGVIGDVLTGRPVCAFGLPLDVDPAIHLGVNPLDGSVVHEFGMISRPDGARHRVWFATTLSIAETRACLAEAEHDWIDAELRGDRALAMSVVELSSASSDAPALVEAALSALAACGAEELLQAGSPDHRDGG